VNLSALPTVYSVFNYKTGLFDYYQPPEQPDLPASGSFRPARGRTPESLAVLVPDGAVLIGSGEQARGLIAALPGNGLGEVSGSASPWLAAAALVGLAALVASRRRKR